MSEQPDDNVDPTQSAILRARFGPYWRAWAWVREQFTPASLTVLGGVIVGAWGYIAHLRESVVQVRERVVVLETKVIPFVQDQSAIATIKTRLDDHDSRLDRLERDWDFAKNESATPPVPGIRRRQ